MKKKILMDGRCKGCTGCPLCVCPVGLNGSTKVVCLGGVKGDIFLNSDHGVTDAMITKIRNAPPRVPLVVEGALSHELPNDDKNNVWQLCHLYKQKGGQLHEVWGELGLSRLRGFLAHAVCM